MSDGVGLGLGFGEGLVALRRPTREEAAAHAADRVAIDELNACFAYALDHSRAQLLVDIFTVDAQYVSNGKRMAGRDAIVASFVSRQSAGPRTTRHMCSGLRLSFEGRVARGSSVWISYAANHAADREAPIGVVVPFMVADFTDRYVLEDDDHWRIAERSIEAVFRNAAAAPLPMA